jgi:hypothetical protein
MGAVAAWAITRLGESWSFLAITKMIRPRMRRARIIRRMMSQKGIPLMKLGPLL